MTIDGKAILKKLADAKKGDRQKISVYLSKSIYKEFQDNCGDIPVSQVLEELLKQFNATAAKKGK